jgi:hypothetical protein
MRQLTMKSLKAQQLLLTCAMITALNGCGRPWPPRPGEPTAPRTAMVSPRDGGSGSLEVEDRWQSAFFRRLSAWPLVSAVSATLASRGE